MTRLLRVAQFVYGEDRCRLVFEPLIADWQRELRGASKAARWWILASGSTALAVTGLICLLGGGTAMPRSVFKTGFGVLIMSTLSLIVIQIGLNAWQFTNDFPFEMRIWIALPMVLPLAIPLAMLPTMMLIRGTSGVTTGRAVILVCVGAVLAYGATGWLTPLMRGDVRDELYEQMEQRVAASEQAGRVFYPTTAVRQVRPTTVEQRAAARERWRSNPLYLADQAERTRPRWGLSTIRMAALALAMGAFGWALGGLRRSRLVHLIAWWSLAWIALLVLDGRFSYTQAL